MFKSFTASVKFIPRYFIFWDDIVKKTVSCFHIVHSRLLKHNHFVLHADLVFDNFADFFY